MSEWISVNEIPEKAINIAIVADKEFKHFGFASYLQINFGKDREWIFESDWKKFKVVMAHYTLLPKFPLPDFPSENIEMTLSQEQAIKNDPSSTLAVIEQLKTKIGKVEQQLSQTQAKLEKAREAKDQIEIVRRIAERGKQYAETYLVSGTGMSENINLWIHILDEIERARQALAEIDNYN